MKKPLRRLIRIVLKYLSLLVLKKHQPDVIVVTGDGQTAISREAIYMVLHETLPTRRNLEAPEAEFSVPLTIFGIKEYPQRYGAWLKILGKTILQLFRLKKHFHILVLELNPNLEEIANYWFDITKPKIVVQCGNLQFNRSYLKDAERLVCKVSTNGYLAPHFEIAQKIGKRYKIPHQNIDRALRKFSLPKARIRLITGKKGKMIVDSSYYYFPPPLQSVLEIINALPGKKVFYTPDKEEEDIIKNEYPKMLIVTSSRDSRIKTADVIIIRGQRNETLKLLKTLSATEFLI